VKKISKKKVKQNSGTAALRPTAAPEELRSSPSLYLRWTGFKREGRASLSKLNLEREGFVANDSKPDP